VNSWSPEFEKHLLSVKSYREFLEAFFKKNALWALPKALTYQKFSLRANLASKSFLNDVISGRKRLTPNSFHNVVLGLGLNKTWSDYLEALVGIEEKAFQNSVLNEPYFAKKIQVIKKRLRQRKASQSQRMVSQLEEVFLEENFPEVYAALGTVEKGSSLKLIAKRAKIPEAKVRLILSKMLEVGLVVHQGETYRPIVEALNVEELKTSFVFQRDFFRSLEKVKKRFPAQVKSESLFLTQTLSVNSGDFKKLRESLASLINDFVADAEAAEGDTIAEINLAFTSV
jgi:uncharacterized protein (TIGR02147 family)